MLTPTKISLRNYCQHIKLDVDLSDSLHMVIGANGRGKSNLLHAINFALTGESTPGAKRLQDDILDGAESATVSLDFTGNDSVKGNITREIRRNGADSAKLTLEGREPIEGANKCRELLEELVGNDLKTVIRTVIVGQHEIREMLFSSSPTKRLEEIQKLLLGDIFSRATESISNERARLYIDENIKSIETNEQLNQMNQYMLQLIQLVQEGQISAEEFYNQMFSYMIVNQTNQEIIIGKDCMFSWDVVILAHDGHLIWTIDGKSINNTSGERNKSIILGDHIWIGGETAILPNTKIGDGVICGYRSLVKGNYPNNCIVCGAPAKIIKKNIAWSRQNVSFDEKGDFNKIKIRNTICQ